MSRAMSSTNLLCSGCCVKLLLRSHVISSVRLPHVRLLSGRRTDGTTVMDKHVLRSRPQVHLLNNGKRSTQLVLAACFSAASLASYNYNKSGGWYNIPVLVGVLFLCYIQFHKTRKREEKRLKALAANPSEVEVDDYLAYLYQFLPLRTGSRVAGFVSERELPRPILNRVLNLYCWYFNVNLQEAAHESVEAYRTIGEFFQRELKPTVRHIDTRRPLVVPCDGRVLHYGKCENGVVEQVKGVRYPVERFLGCQPTLADAEKNDLFYCVLYLAPGDYHLFHSPCSWTVDKVIHFPGTLMSVNPFICKLVRNVLTLNERVLMSGSWEHGYFSYTAVGATNVGSIKINFLQDKIKTNKGFLSFEKDTEIDISPTETMNRGDMIGGFNFGSTIVLMFEAPKTFQFNLTADKKIRLGDPLGDITRESTVLDELKETLGQVVQTLSEQTEQLIISVDDVIEQGVEQLQCTIPDLIEEQEKE